MKTPKYTYHARVTCAYDGDSITADIDLGLNTWAMNQKLRLYGINTPELRGADRDRGLAARYYVRNELLIKQDGDAIITTIKDRSGKYGRLLAVVWIGREYERNLNEELVTLGHAVPYMI